jgi:hypothetical protein
MTIISKKKQTIFASFSLLRFARIRMYCCLKFSQAISYRYLRRWRPFRFARHSQGPERRTQQHPSDRPIWKKTSKNSVVDPDVWDRILILDYTICHKDNLPELFLLTKCVVNTMKNRYR